MLMKVQKSLKLIPHSIKGSRSIVIQGRWPESMYRSISIATSLPSLLHPAFEEEGENRQSIRIIKDTNV